MNDNEEELLGQCIVASLSVVELLRKNTVNLSKMSFDAFEKTNLVSFFDLYLLFAIR